MLLNESINIIKKNQTPYGSFPASPNFNVYNYCWLRDGCFIAYALDVVKEHSSSEKFYKWVNCVIGRYKGKIDNVLKKINNGEKLAKKDFLFARYMLDGYEEKEEGWGIFQLDGYGIWLWGISEHVAMTDNFKLIDEFRVNIYKVIQYIGNIWYYPNYDVWEENGDKIHTSTLAALYGGLNSINKYLKDIEVQMIANRIKSYILSNCINENKFVKYVGSNIVDSSLLWLVLPFEVVDINNEIFKNTVNEIESTLFHNGGVHRYADDTYYGGGEWILLSAWLGWYYCKINDREKATIVKRWIEQHADENYYLPEQVCDHLNDVSYYKYWFEKWGKIANPLLWSHAMYIIFYTEFKRRFEE